MNEPEIESVELDLNYFLESDDFEVMVMSKADANEVRAYIQALLNVTQVTPPDIVAQFLGTGDGA